MSFNLIHRKNGVDVPIKVSLLDIFRPSLPRSSPPRPSISQATLTRPFNPNHNGNNFQNHPNAQGSPNKQNNNNGQPAPNGENGPNFSNHDMESYTDADNAKVIAMKAEEKNWGEILKEINKTSKSQLQKHFKDNLRDMSDEDKKKLRDRVAKSEGNKKNGQANQDGGKGKNGGGGERGVGNSNNNNSNSSNNGGKKKNKGKTQNQGNSNNAASAMPDTPKDQIRKDMVAFVAKYERDVWLAAASRHFDRTGQRISAEHAKAMKEGRV